MECWVIWIMAAAFWRCVSNMICSQKRNNQMLLKYRKFTGKEWSKVIMTVVWLLIETLVSVSISADVYSGVLWLVYRYSAYFRYRLKRKSSEKPAAWFLSCTDCAYVRNTDLGYEIDLWFGCPQDKRKLKSPVWETA